MGCGEVRTHIVHSRMYALLSAPRTPLVRCRAKVWVGCGKLGIDGGFGEEELRVRTLTSAHPFPSHPLLYFALNHPACPTFEFERASKSCSSLMSVAAHSLPLEARAFTPPASPRTHHSRNTHRMSLGSTARLSRCAPVTRLTLSALSLRHYFF